MRNNQLVSAYALYMIIGSEFQSCRFINPMIEGRLRIEYMETKSADQIRVEDEVISILPELDIQDVPCEIRYYNDGSELILDFISDDGVIRAAISPRGQFRVKQRQKARQLV